MHTLHTATDGFVVDRAARAEVMARRRTADGMIVELWSDSSVTTGAFGTIVVGATAAASDETVRLNVLAGWLAINDACLYDAAEIRALVLAARKGVRQASVDPLAYMRRAMNGPAAIKPVWSVLETDRDGRPVVRVWRLPALAFGRGMAVWNERGCYELMREIPGSRGTYAPTGIRASSLRDLNLDQHRQTGGTL
jgi:hypothetical protein